MINFTNEEKKGILAGCALIALLYLFYLFLMSMVGHTKCINGKIHLCDGGICQEKISACVPEPSP